MTKRKPTTTRRDVLAGAGFFAGIAVAAPALAMSARDAEWEKIADLAHNWHPERGRQVVQIARAAGLDPFAWSGMTFAANSRMVDRRNFPQMYFETAGATWRVTPRGCRKVK